MSLSKPWLVDKMALRGDLTVSMRRVSDGRVRRIIVQNTITYRGIDSPLYLWAPDGISQADYAFNALGLGDNATAPTHGDLALLSQFGSLALNSPGNRVRSVGQVEVVATLPAGSLVGNTIREFGIILANGQLFARQTTPDIPLTGLFEIGVSWRITVTTV